MTPRNYLRLAPPITAAQAKTLLVSIGTEECVSWRNRAFLALRSVCPEPIKALSQLRLCDLSRTEDCYVLHWVRRDGLCRSKPLPPNIDALIEDYLQRTGLAAAGPDAPLFPRYSRRHGCFTATPVSPVAMANSIRVAFRQIGWHASRAAKIARRLRPDELRTLLAAMPARPPVGFRDRAILGLLLYGIATPENISALLVRDLAAEAGGWLLRGVRLPARLAAMLSQYHEGAALPRAPGYQPLFFSTTSSQANKPVEPLGLNRLNAMTSQRLRAAGLPANLELFAALSDSAVND